MVESVPSSGMVVIDVPSPTWLLVINLTQDTTLYNPLASIGGVAEVGNVLNVDLDTSSMSAADELLILVDAHGSDLSEQTLHNILDELKKQTTILELMAGG